MTNVQTASMSETATQSFIRCLYGLLLAQTQQGLLPTVQKVLNANMKPSAPFFKAFHSEAYRNSLKALSDRDYEALSANLILLGKDLKNLIPAMNQEHDITHGQLELISKLAFWFRSRSEGAFRTLEKRVSESGSEDLRGSFIKDVGKQQPIKSALARIVKAVTGKPGQALTQEQIDRLAKKQPDLLKEYRRLRSSFNNVTKDAVATYVRQSGKQLVPYTDVLTFLKAQGIENKLPVGFTGKINDQGEFYTNDNKLIVGVPNGHMFPKIVMNPQYGKQGAPDWVYKAIREDGTPGKSFYTREYLKGQKTKKFNNVGDLTPKIPGIRKKWLPHVKNFQLNNVTCVASTELEILFQFSARIGGLSGEAGGVQTFGISSLQVKHLFPQANGGINIIYLGKDAVKTKHVLSPSDPIHKLVIRNLNELTRGKAAKEFVFTVRKGTKDRRVPAAIVNKLFQSYGAGELTVHKLRTYRGTVVFTTLMDKELAKKTSRDEKEGMAVFVKIASQVGKLLNHVKRFKDGTQSISWKTSVNAYISPTAMLQFWDRQGLRPPKFLEKYIVK